jgi:serine/threonine-protein kinase RsbW
MNVHVELELPNDARLLPRTRWVLLGYLEELGIDVDATADVVLAIDEACANVVRHAFPEGGGSYRVIADLSDSEAVIEVVDSGVGFNPFEVTGLGVEREAVAGRGLHIIRQVMSSLEVESPMPEGGTRLRMQKRLQNGSGSHATDGAFDTVPRW